MINVNDFENGDGGILKNGIKQEYLIRINNEIKKSRNFIFLAGDSSLDNKYWFERLKITDKGIPLNGYEEIIEGDMTKDVTWNINNTLIQQRLGNKYVCINTSYEGTTLEERLYSLYYDSDIFIREHIQPNDILIVSVGKNDITSTIMADIEKTNEITINILYLLEQDLEKVDINSSQFKFLINIFKDKIEIYIKKLCEKNTPKYIIVNTIYYPYEFLEEFVEDSWANDALNIVRYTNEDGINKFKKLIRLIYVYATCKINIDNSIIIPVPLFEVLDSTLKKEDGTSFDYYYRAEPSLEGSIKMAKKFVDLILLYDSNITNTERLNTTLLKKYIYNLSNEANKLNKNEKLDISVYNGLKLKIYNFLNYIHDKFHFAIYVFTRDPLDTERKDNMINLLKSLYEGEITVVTNLSDPSYNPAIWGLAIEFIERKSVNVKEYLKLKNVTSFIINKIPDGLYPDMNDGKLTHEEYAIGNILNNYNLNTLRHPDVRGSGTQDEEDDSRGLGFWEENYAIVTLVEK
jgi:hypothetical protein